jgi:transcriptional regulator GlxA family with amidase domain
VESRRGSRRTVAADSLTRHQVIESVEAYVRAALPIVVPLSTLARVVGLSERGLRDVFYRVHGLSPTRWMLTARLQGARRALRSAPEGTATVTGIATDYGFNELGRFAATYKAAYGEAPSATLRARGQKTRRLNAHERPADACKSQSRS